MAKTFLKDPNSVEPYHIIWCSADATNDASTNDTGELQGATISTTTWVVPTGITKSSDNKEQITIQGVTYAASTTTTIWLSGGTAFQDYEVVNRITTSDSRTLDQTLVIRCREQ